MTVLLKRREIAEKIKDLIFNACWLRLGCVQVRRVQAVNLVLKVENGTKNYTKVSGDRLRIRKF